MLALFVLWGAGLGARTALHEMASSEYQAAYFSERARDLRYAADGRGDAFVPRVRGGPYDERLGYRDLGRMVARAEAGGFEVVRQAARSPALEEFIRKHGYAAFYEKHAAGLRIVGRSGADIYRAQHPEQVYRSFDEIPPLMVGMLLFIEDQRLLDPAHPYRNPAVDWKRFIFASAGHVAANVIPELRQGGASTLATQLEKFRHYPDGRTRNVRDKLAQMLAASTRSYLRGPNTVAAREWIVTSYINATPLSARPGFGEVIGVGDGMWAWYGKRLDEVTSALNDGSADGLQARAETLKQVLSLFVAQRRPAYYLNEGRSDLARLVEEYLVRLEREGVIAPDLRKAASAAPLVLLPDAPAPESPDFIGNKAANKVRVLVQGLLGTGNLYQLDRHDLTVSTTLQKQAQDSVTAVLRDMHDRKHVRKAGFTAANMLGRNDPSDVKYSFVLHERGKDRNYVRVHADNLDRPFDMNSGSKMILGSTAKLRTTISYLNIVETLHDRFVHSSPWRLRTIVARAGDPLTRWAAEYLATAPDRSLPAMLAAAMQRQYAADPDETFYTGGGEHRFHNFSTRQDDTLPTVQEALEQSVNLPFIRLMRDVRDFYIGEQGDASALAADREDAARMRVLSRFADREGTLYLDRFRQQFAGRRGDAIVEFMLGKVRSSERRMALLYRCLAPDASADDFRRVMARQGTKLSTKQARALFFAQDPRKLSLGDRAYLARVHPLQLWLAAYLIEHPDARRRDIIEASATVRQDAYRWLFRTRNIAAQNTRIRDTIEQDAFAAIHEDWRRQGYPFASLVPSLATALGSSGDRPDALAELMGIILNDGVHQPTVTLEELHFAEGTPYEVKLQRTAPGRMRVLTPEVARAARAALEGVVETGTARRVASAFEDGEGRALVVGGKTGTGDNRENGRGSRPVDRTATFVFFIGENFYGTVTARVAGPAAGKFNFTSALVTELLKQLAPAIQPLLENPVETFTGPQLIADMQRNDLGTLLPASDLARPAEPPALATLSTVPFDRLPLRMLDSVITVPDKRSIFVAEDRPLQASEPRTDSAGLLRSRPERASEPPNRSRVTIGRRSPAERRSEAEITAELNRRSAAGLLNRQRRAAQEYQRQRDRAYERTYGYGRGRYDRGYYGPYDRGFFDRRR